MTMVRFLTGRYCLPVLAVFCLLDCVQAEVHLHHIFDNNMVLQREKPLRVWGGADAGEAVTVQFAGQTKTVTAGRDGTWAVDLDPLEARTEPSVLVVKGKANTVTCDNVLVGDVWVLGGQSNMEDTISNVYHGDVEVASANLPFGIVELTAGGQPQTLENFELRMVDAAPYIREAQFRAYRELPHVGFACAYDQQVPWYHPHKKVLLGERIARWALATQYDVKLGWEPAVCTSAKPEGNRMVLTFDRVVQTHDGRPIEGFAIAGDDKRFCPAEVQYAVVGKDERGRDREDRNVLEVRSELVRAPVAVRYAWARNPLGNLVNGQHHERILPVPCFRTDDWDWPEAPFGPEARGEIGRRRAEMRRQAEEHNQQRKLQEAKLLLQRLLKD